MQKQTKETLWFAAWILLVFVLAVVSAWKATAEYNRKDWHPYWSDADKDCQSARQEILIRDSLIPVELDSKGCRVLSGLWEDPYSGARYSNPAVLDIEHIVPLAEASKSGGEAWKTFYKRQFSNEIYGYNLIAVHRSLNRSKGAKPPQSWRPPNRAYWCEYARRWEAVKTKWGLKISVTEGYALEEMKATCKEPEPHELEI